MYTKTELIKYAEFYICMVEYFDGIEPVFTFVTRVPKYYSNNEKYEFYDLIKNKNVNLDNILNFKIYFSPKTPSFYVFNKKIDNKELDEHYKNCEEFIHEFVTQNKKKLNESFNSWKNMEYFDLKEECIERLFFIPESSDREKLLKEMKNRLKYLQTVVDGGVISKLLSILEISEDKLYVEDKGIVNSCKEKWKGVIKFYANKAFKQLDEEIKNITHKEDKNDMLIESQEIKKMIVEMCDEINTKEFKTPQEVVGFWPALLKPSPVYVIEKK